MSEDKKFDLNDTEYVNSHIDAINNMMLSRNYALLNGLSVNVTNTRHRRITREQIRRALDNPFDNIELLQQASIMMKYTNGIYQEVLDYQANMLTNDYMLIPMNMGRVKTEEKMLKLLEDQSNFVAKFNIKYYASWIYKRVLEQGELFVYKIETNDGIILQEIPNLFCKITSKQNSIHRFAIDLSKLTDKTVKYMPTEIQNAYSSFKDRSKKNDKLIDNSYYQIDKLGVAFTLEENASKSLPYYCAVFDDLIELEDKKDRKSENDIIDAIKLIHQKVPYNKETGQVLLNSKQATTIHNATKASLPKNGTSIVTNHLDTEILTLGDNNSRLSNSVEEATHNVFNSAGINAELFNGKKNSNQAIISGIVVDSLVPRKLQRMVENWMNYELSQNKKSGVQFKLKFIDTTHFDKEIRAKSSRENMAYGGSRFEFLATSGYEPMDGINVLKMESILNMDSIMIPQQSSHTLSGDSGRSSNNEESSTSTAEEE